MRRVYLTLLLFSILLFSFYESVKADTLRIALITDLHYLSPELSVEGDALNAYEELTGRNIKDLHEVFDKVLDDIICEGVDILLVAGDITNHGEKLSHKGFIERISPLTETGTRVFVVPGNHDINIPDSKAYTGVGAVTTENVSKDDFVKLYKTFGYSGAIKRDEVSLSYLAELNENTWLLAIDTNRYDEYDKGYLSGGRIKQQTMVWILDILKEADSKGVRVLGMMHHGLLEHMLYQSTFFPDYLIEDWQENADLLAEAGLEVVFTGHFHSNDITSYTTTSGKTIYDVETASLAQYPFAYRIMKLSDNDLSVDTRFVTEIAGNPDLEEEYLNKLETITRRVADSRLKNLGLPLSDDMKEFLADFIVKLNIAHVKGDEELSPELMTTIKSFAKYLDNEFKEEDYSLDFPPADNKLVIKFSSPVDN
ncbi:MAG: metallophosphoesterase [Fermentimonas sp.]|nr:metallophosphoesterase [Fermentimonas sp.]